MTKIRVIVQKECNCKGSGCDKCGGSGWLEMPPMVQAIPRWMFETPAEQTGSKHMLREGECYVAGIRNCAECQDELGIGIRIESKGMTMCPKCYDRMRDGEKEGPLKISYGLQTYALRNDEKLIVDGAYMCFTCGISYEARRTNGVSLRTYDKSRYCLCNACYAAYRDNLNKAAEGALKGTKEPSFFSQVHPELKGYILMAPNRDARGAFHHEPHQEACMCKEEGCVPMQGREDGP